MPLLHTHALCVQAGGKTLCRNVDLSVARGEFWCVLGKNGAGKSTLLHTLAGLVAPANGMIYLRGCDIRDSPPEILARQRGLLAQQQFDVFSSTAFETVLAARYPFQVGLGWESANDCQIARQALQTVGLDDCIEKDVLRLSGGERQRVGLAALLAQDPDILLLDEPTAHQDAAAQLTVMGLIRDMACGVSAIGAEGKAVIAACHDINLVSRFATHVLILSSNQHWMGPVDSVLVPSVLQLAFNCRFDMIKTPQGPFFIPLAE